MKKLLALFAVLLAFLLTAIIPPLAAEPAPRNVRVLVVNREEKQLVILDPSTREIVAKVPTGNATSRKPRAKFRLSR